MEVALTQGYVIGKNKFQSILLSAKLNAPYHNSSFFLVVYAIHADLTRITCYPLKSEELWKFTITLNSIQGNTMELLSAKTENFKLIHTTGLCEASKKYMIENYIRLADSSNQDQLQCIKKSIEQVTSINECNFEKVEVLN